MKQYKTTPTHSPSIPVQSLVVGKPYLVKYRGGKQTVRRIYRGLETRFDIIKCYVFTSKVGKDVFAEINGNTWHWKNTNKVPAQEVSIPYYDLINIHQTD